MPNTQHSNRCRVYLHPTAAKSQASVEAIQRKTGLLVILNTKREPIGTLSDVTWPDESPWGGDAA
ncbi:MULTISPECIES: hypothetical protein [unclassified Pseudomonas]|uniref:hypothetical protein n=1 Tax=unclassified Pseudomonas TaxID=196821 RepID=UPI0025E21215|nr:MULTISPECIES: hypothetical protein [unclassified Pseudomonas]